MIETSQDIVSCYSVNYMLLDLTWWRNSHLVGLRSDYEGCQSKEASKEYKILFIGIVYKVTWKAMNKNLKAFRVIQLLCLPTFLHLRMRPKVCWFWSAMRRQDAPTTQSLLESGFDSHSSVSSRRLSQGAFPLCSAAPTSVGCRPLLVRSSSAGRGERLCRAASHSRATSRALSCTPHADTWGRWATDISRFSPQIDLIT